MDFQSEFRKKSRVAVNLLAGVEGDHNIDFAHRTKIKNMNMAGMSVETSMLFKIGEKRNFRFFINNGESVSLLCRVIWSKSENKVNAYGLLYTDLDMWKKIKLQRFLIKRRFQNAALA